MIDDFAKEYLHSELRDAVRCRWALGFGSDWGRTNRLGVDGQFNRGIRTRTTPLRAVGHLDESLQSC